MIHAIPAAVARRKKPVTRIQPEPRKVDRRESPKSSPVTVAFAIAAVISFVGLAISWFAG